MPDQHRVFEARVQVLPTRHPSALPTPTRDTSCAFLSCPACTGIGPHTWYRARTESAFPLGRTEWSRSSSSTDASHLVLSARDRQLCANATSVDKTFPLVLRSLRCRKLAHVIAPNWLRIAHSSPSAADLGQAQSRILKTKCTASELPVWGRHCAESRHSRPEHRAKWPGAGPLARALASSC